MKIALIILGIITALIVAFFLIGIFAPTVTVVSEVTVNKPVDQVWKIFNDESRMGEWLPGFKKVEIISGKPNEVGSKYKLYFEEQGKEMIFIEEITSFKENDEFGFLLDHEMMTNNILVKFYPKGDHTDIKVTSTAEGKGMVWKSVFALSKGAMQQRNDESYNKLKGIIEGS